MPDARIDCPYPGLRAYFTGERDWYFGREEHVDAMLSRLEESRFLAVVGSSGSGKSSLVFAGLIPALGEGQLAGSRRDDEGGPAPWSVICFNPGNDPLAELAAAIGKAAVKKDDPHLPGYVRAALESSGGLIEALNVAGLIDPKRETLVYADQFEELFRFGEKASRVAQETALRFASLFVAAAEQAQVRLHVLLSMRSEFIGQCEAFPGLSEIVSRSQFLTPRLSRKQLERSLSCPAAAVGWKLAPDALAAILNDCGNSPDQLPLAQHILRRMWMRAAAAQRQELTLEDYNAEGGIRKSIAKHGQEILDGLPQPGGTEVTRNLFMALCEQREEGPLVRRLSTRAEVEAIAGENSALVPRVIAAFSGNDPGFIAEDDGWLDVRHEAVLRQWPLISEWRTIENESETWLHELSQAAKDYDKESGKMELWRGNDLREADAWFGKEKPSEAWAIRHGIRNWGKCVQFLEISRQAAISREEEKKKEAREAREEKERRQKRRSLAIAGFAVFLLIACVVMAIFWRMAVKAQLEAMVSSWEAGLNKTAAEQASADRLKLMQAIVVAAGPIIDSGKAALNEAEERELQLTSAISEAAVEPPPEQAAIEEVGHARNDAGKAVKAIIDLVDAIKQAARTDDEIGHAAADLDKQAREVAQRFGLLEKNPKNWGAIRNTVEARLAEAEKALAGLIGVEPLNAALLKEKDQKDIPEAIAQMDAIRAIRKAAAALGFYDSDFQIFFDRLARIEKTVSAARAAKDVGPSTAQIAVWKPDVAVPLVHQGGSVYRVRFAPLIAGKIPVIASASGDQQVWFWKADGTNLEKFPLGCPVTDIAFAPSGDALVAAGKAKQVRVFHWKKMPAQDTLETADFLQHSDTITDVEFSHRGQRIASASGDRTVRVFDSHSLAPVYFTSPPLPGIVTSIAFHPGDNLIVSACDDGGVRLHTIDLPGVRLLGKMDAPARRAAFSVDGKMVIAASGDKTARVWSTEPPHQILRLEHPASVTHATFRPVKEATGYTFATCSTNGEVRLVRMTKVTASSAEHVEKVLEPRHSAAALFAVWSNDGHWLATVGGGETLIWEWRGDGLVAVLRLAGVPGTLRAMFSSDGKLLATSGGNDTAYLWDLTKLPAAAR
jgi:WD40 repeat protein/energy-coupling factor transporter ATP-binding protein EcfA2